MTLIGETRIQGDLPSRPITPHQFHLTPVRPQLRHEIRHGTAERPAERPTGVDRVDARATGQVPNPLGVPMWGVGAPDGVASGMVVQK